MDQISMPLRIALGVTLALCALWFAALRPDVAAEETVPVEASAALSGAVKDARGAADASATSAAQREPAAQVAEARAPGQAIAAKPERVRVLLFFNPHGADDRAVRSAVDGVDRRDGRVAVRAVSISRLGEFTDELRGVSVTQAPTVVVVGRDGAAQTITGLTETAEIDQAVGDALRRR
jgi:hypothetical protein